MTARRSLIAAGLIGLACLVACQSGSDTTTTLTLELDSADPDIQQRAAEVIRGRLEQRGVRGLVVDGEGSDRIVVSFRGDRDAKRLGALVCRTATLEFRFVRPLEEWLPTLEKLDTVCRVRDPEGEPFTTLIAPATTFEQVMSVPAPHLDRVRAMIADPQVQRAVGAGVVQVSIEPENPSAAEPAHSLYLLDERPILTGQDIESATASPATNRPGSWVINIELGQLGAQTFARATGENVGRNLAICLDGEVVSAPRINSAIPGGKAVIEGMFTRDEASDLAFLLNAGGLPATIKVIDVQVD